MEDYPIRAIVIGVSVFVTMLTLSVILIYYNTARNTANVAMKRTDIASSFEEIVNADNFEGNLSGVEVRSLIRKYAGKENVRINIVEIKGVKTDKYNNVNNSWCENSMILDKKLDMIEPTSTNHAVKTVENADSIVIEISLDVNK